MKKICQIYYDASHYREAIYRKIDEEFDSDIVIGLPPTEGIEQMNTKGLKGKVKYTKILAWHSIFYQKSILSLIWEPYDIYLGLGETHGISTWLFPILVRLFKPKKKVFFWSHGWYGKESGIEKFVKKIFFNLPNGGVFLYGNYARDLMIKEGFSPDKLYTIHNSLNYHRQKEIRDSIIPSTIFLDHFGNDNPIIIFIGRLTKVKKLDMLIDALSVLNEKNRYYNLVFVGDGTERQSLEAKVDSLQLSEQVWFYGACYDEKTNAELIYNADLCVAPGNVGLTAMHTMVYGTPVISHNDFKWQMPEFEAIIPGKTGNFYENGDVDSLAQAIGGWFETHKNRNEIRQACYKEIDDNWTPDYQIKVLKEHLK